MLPGSHTVALMALAGAVLPPGEAMGPLLWEGGGGGLERHSATPFFRHRMPDLAASHGDLVVVFVVGGGGQCFQFMWCLQFEGTGPNHKDAHTLTPTIMVIGLTRGTRISG